MDAWLDADVQRITAALSSRLHPAHYRSNVHPLWSLLVASPFVGIAGTIGLSSAIKAYVGAVAAALGALLFATARCLRLTRPDAVLVCGLFLSSATATFWLPIPEVHLAGGASLLMAVVWLATPRFHHSFGATVQLIATFAVTISNVLMGALAAFIAFGRRRAIHVGLVALGVSCALLLVQSSIYSHASKLPRVWLELRGLGETARLGGTVGQHVQVFFLHSLAFPEPSLFAWDDATAENMLSRIQFSAPSTAPSALVVFVSWLGLFALSVPGLRRSDRNVTLMVVACCGYPLVLHMIYGWETFLYAPHHAPFLALIAGHASHVRSGGFRALAIIGICAGFVHNLPAFFDLAHWFNGLEPSQITMSAWPSVCASPWAPTSN